MQGRGRHSQYVTATYILYSTDGINWSNAQVNGVSVSQNKWSQVFICRWCTLISQQNHVNLTSEEGWDYERHNVLSSIIERYLKYDSHTYGCENIKRIWRRLLQIQYKTFSYIIFVKNTLVIEVEMWFCTSMYTSYIDICKTYFCTLDFIVYIYWKHPRWQQGNTHIWCSYICPLCQDKPSGVVWLAFLQIWTAWLW